MKKHLINFNLIFIALGFLTSCNDDFLERFPLDQISNETFWNTASDLENYNNNLYNLTLNENDNWVLPGYNINGFESHRMSIYTFDYCSDDIAPTHSRTLNWQQMRAGKYVAQNNPEGGGWRWAMLRSCNFFLANYQRAQISLDEKNKYAAEVKLFRAMFYFDKVIKYGNVPWISKPLNIDSPELFAARDSREMVMDSVLADLNFAVTYLPVSWNTDSPGRLNRWVGLLAKSRICLFEGTFRKYRGQPNSVMWLTEAASAAKSIIDNGPYRIYSTGDILNDLRYLFTQENLAGNPEIMYWRKYDLTSIVNNVGYFDAYNGGATRDFAEDFLCTDGLPINLSPLYKGDSLVQNTYVNRDPRMRNTLLYPPDQPRVLFWGGDLTSVMPIMDYQTTGWDIIKRYNVTGYNFGNWDLACPVFRYAEVLLNFAEAKAELGTITQGDLDISINKLRDRVKMPHMDLTKIVVDPRYTSDGITPLIAEIRRERRVELFDEGFRFNDLKRWKQGKKLTKKSMGIRWEAPQKALWPITPLKATFDPVRGHSYIEVYKGTDFENPVFDEAKHYLFPLPINVLSQNPALLQNPGY